ncbi:hypothetical protein HAX54_003585, partial [Datura stramonium]|nr:hypothetical protein [Datura stramonium]
LQIIRLVIVMMIRVVGVLVTNVMVMVGSGGCDGERFVAVVVVSDSDGRSGNSYDSSGGGGSNNEYIIMME